MDTTFGVTFLTVCFKLQEEYFLEVTEAEFFPRHKKALSELKLEIYHQKLNKAKLNFIRSQCDTYYQFYLKLVISIRNLNMQNLI